MVLLAQNLAQLQQARVLLVDLQELVLVCCDYLKLVALMVAQVQQVQELKQVVAQVQLVLVHLQLGQELLLSVSVELHHLVHLRLGYLALHPTDLHLTNLAAEPLPRYCLKQLRTPFHFYGSTQPKLDQLN
jgi:hypothetical protein